MREAPLVSNLLRSFSITKMLKFNFATKQLFPMTTREAYSWHSHRIKTAIHSELQRAVLIFDVTDADLQFHDQTSVYGDETHEHI